MRLKSAIWVAAYIRRCHAEGAFAAVRRRGAEEADKEGKDEHKMMLAADAKIMCDGKECKLTDLKEGVMIRVTTAEGKRSNRALSSRTSSTRFGSRFQLSSEQSMKSGRAPK